MALAVGSIEKSVSKLRLESIDAVRGLIMIIMALDHVRDFFHAGAAQVRPEDLARTTAAIFLTRWITHFCAPVFMFSAGLGAFLWARGRSRGELSRFLATRGLWLVLLEITAVRLALNFNLDNSLVLLTVLWALGWAMVALAGLVWLGNRALLAVSLGMIAAHNLLDGIRAAQLGSAAWVWNILHQSGAFQVGGHTILIGYPLIPWVGVMAAGYAFGNVFTLDPARRRRLVIRTGLILTAAFVLIRAVNIYGDPAPWKVQRSALFTVLSFLNCTKYPPSLEFLLMTLGPALLVTAWFEKIPWSRANPLQVFGRVPLFYYLCHLALIHALAAALDWARFGRTVLWFNAPLSAGGGRQLLPPDYGYDLWVCYAVWLLLVVLLYPICRWYAELKRRRRDWWLSYL